MSTLQSTDVKTLLASRMMIHDNAIGKARADVKHGYTPADFENAARTLNASLQALQELEAVWEALFEEKPSALVVRRMSVVTSRTGA